tara:strand:- start:808 stop:1776 length:969 start_codon:yes stop_codon:yes gene_type:complete
MTYVLIIAGFILLLLGGESVVRGSIALARRLGVSPLIVGLTVVGLGTSLPEMVVSVNAGLAGSPGLAVGNVIGSNIANIFLILGVAVLIAPFSVHPKAVRRDALAMGAVTLTFVCLGMTGHIAQWHGIAMIFILIAYIGFSVWRDQTANQLAVDMGAEEVTGVEIVKLSTVSICGLIIAGLILLVVGAELLVTAAITLAMALGVPKEVIGLTVFALGTSLPELSASIVAAYRGHSDVCIGNILGSNLFNLFGITGITALLVPLPFSEKIVSFDLWILLLATAILLPFLLSGQKFYRLLGLLFLCGYICFVGAQYTVLGGMTI